MTVPRLCRHPAHLIPLVIRRESRRVPRRDGLRWAEMARATTLVRLRTCRSGVRFTPGALANSPRYTARRRSRRRTLGRFVGIGLVDVLDGRLCCRCLVDEAADGIEDGTEVRRAERSNTARVLWPVMPIAMRSGTPRRGGDVERLDACDLPVDRRCRPASPDCGAGSRRGRILRRSRPQPFACCLLVLR